jgi:hypothetical protein
MKNNCKMKEKHLSFLTLLHKMTRSANNMLPIIQFLTIDDINI